MTSTPRLSCRLHGTTGRLSCSYSTSSRSPVNSSASAPEAGERSRREAARRARLRVQELVHDYDLRLLSTYSYAVAPTCIEEVFSTLAAFSRRLRDAGTTLPRLTVPELSPAGRWHLHMATSTYPGTELMSELWGNGTVHGPDLHQAGLEDALSRLASYLSKNFDSTAKGVRRYTTSAGLRPLEHRFTARTAEEALALAIQRFGADPTHADWYGGTFMAFFQPMPSRAAA